MQLLVSIWFSPYFSCFSQHPVRAFEMVVQALSYPPCEPGLLLKYSTINLYVKNWNNTRLGGTPCWSDSFFLFFFSSLLPRGDVWTSERGDTVILGIRSWHSSQCVAPILHAPFSTIFIWAKLGLAGRENWPGNAAGHLFLVLSIRCIHANVTFLKSRRGL